MTLCILNSSIWGCPSGGQLTGRVTHPVSASHCPLRERATILFLRGQRSSQQLEAAEPCLWMKWLGSSNSKAVNQIPSSKKTQSEGVLQWKERKQGSRKWLLKRCILFNLAIRKLNCLNKRRVSYLHRRSRIPPTGKCGKKGIKEDKKSQMRITEFLRRILELSYRGYLQLTNI